MKLAVCMVVSPGEERIAGDCLSRIASLMPDDIQYGLVMGNNTGQALDRLWQDRFKTLTCIDIPGAPRPYFEIG